MNKLLIGLAAVTFCVTTAGAQQVNPGMLMMFKPAPPADAIPSPANPLTPEKIDLGRMLYYETRLSKNQQISCNTCHDLANYGVDNKPVSLGHKNQEGARNSPTVYFAAGHIAQFWDGRAATVEEQAGMPILNPVEMAMPDKDYAIKVLKSIPGYVEAFKKAFPGEAEPITYDNLQKAIGAFERKLVTPSRWQKFLGGDDSALTSQEKQGFNDFIAAGCMTCHMQTYLGGNMYQKLGLVKPWPNQKDQGRFEVTKNEADRMMFKSPSLLNVAKTAPYFHDGSIATLEEATKLMAEYQLGRQLTDAQVDSIVTFLNALTGEIPTEYIKKPDLPPNGPNTPAPVLD